MICWLPWFHLLSWINLITSNIEVTPSTTSDASPNYPWCCYEQVWAIVFDVLGYTEWTRSDSDYPCKGVQAHFMHVLNHVISSFTQGITNELRLEADWQHFPLLLPKSLQKQYVRDFSLQRSTCLLPWAITSMWILTKKCLYKKRSRNIV